MAQNKLPKYPNLDKLPAIVVIPMNYCPVCETDLRLLGFEEDEHRFLGSHVDECLAFQGRDWDSLSLGEIAGIEGLEAAKEHQKDRAKAKYERDCDAYFLAEYGEV